MRLARMILLVPLLAGLAGCATQSPHLVPPPVSKPLPPPPPPPKPPQPFFSEAGLASWYGKARHGKTTADGERFNPKALTAAQRCLPFNTIVRVRDLQTGKRVKVRINDRGPFDKGRIIDLTPAAAARLGMTKKGVNRVQLKAFASDQTHAVRKDTACAAGRSATASVSARRT